MMTIRSRRFVLLLLLAVLAGSVVGCGNKGELVRPAPPTRG